MNLHIGQRVRILAGEHAGKIGEVVATSGRDRTFLVDFKDGTFSAWLPMDGDGFEVRS